MDPFDRMLIAQAQSEQLALVTRDAEIQKYQVHCLIA
jgi:PIN domain nuclease of toxin-antitoxin system